MSLLGGAEEIPVVARLLTPDIRETADFDRPQRLPEISENAPLIVQQSEDTILSDLAWRKGEYCIVPYGIGWLNVAFDTSRTSTSPFV